MFNDFKKAVEQKKGDKSEVEAFKTVMEAESMDVNEVLVRAEQLVLIGLMKAGERSRPIVINYEEGHEYPKPDRFVTFEELNLAEDLVGLQDVLDVVPDPCFETGAIMHPFEGLELFNLETVYGAKKNGRAHLTLAEAVSQLAQKYDRGETFFFYICDSAEDCQYLTSLEGYQAYRVAVYKPQRVEAGMLPNVNIVFE